MDLKRFIDDNKTEVIRFLTIYGFCFGSFLIIQIFTGVLGILFLVVVPIMMAVVVMFSLNEIGNTFGKGFYGGRRLRLSVDELLRGELDKIKFSKRNGRFEEALRITNELLKKAPDYPEALFLKAQILHEAYDFHESARKCLQTIIDTVPSDKDIHRWASNYLEQISLPGEERIEDTGES